MRLFEELDLDKASRLDPVPDLLLDGVGDVVDDWWAVKPLLMPSQWRSESVGVRLLAGCRVDVGAVGRGAGHEQHLVQGAQGAPGRCEPGLRNGQGNLRGE